MGGMPQLSTSPFIGSPSNLAIRIAHFFPRTFADDYLPLAHNHFIALLHLLHAKADLASTVQLKAVS
jgi:hypothetical protein